MTSRAANEGYVMTPRRAECIELVTRQVVAHRFRWAAPPAEAAAEGGTGIRGSRVCRRAKCPMPS